MLMFIFWDYHQKWKNTFFFSIIAENSAPWAHLFWLPLKKHRFQMLSLRPSSYCASTMVACGWPYFPRGWFYSHLSCAPGRGRGVKQMRAVWSEREKWSKRTTQGTARTTLTMTAEDGAHQVHSPGQQRQKMLRRGVWRQPESEELVPWHRAGDT